MKPVCITRRTRRVRIASSSSNETGDRTGGLNGAFRYVYSVRLAGKRLTAWNRSVYYVVKRVLFGGIALAIFWR
ncbi:hypothetical protein C7402_10127 [Paraburkholderia unamae]|uniref:Uncharacterized protein n=1 Tax=Paraburkholderia unamae TaxID=219649 RepID=A0ABX5KUH2_9BURK|nr:hypothetical protein C7402_10127 [Paraburkholderia unamae]